MLANLDRLAKASFGGPANGYSSTFAHLDEYTSEYFEIGMGAPLVLIPGLAGGIELLRPLAEQLARRFRVICFQLRGENDCFALRRRFGLDELVSDVIEFLDFKRLERPALMGVSFGGILALELAARAPNRIEALVVQGVGARYERSLLQRVASMVLRHYPLPNDSAFVNQFFKLLFGGKNTPSSVLDFVTRRCWETDQGIMAHRFQLAETFDVRKRLTSIRSRTLILAGDRDLSLSRNGVNELSAGIRDSRSVTLTGCGHLAFVAQSERVAKEVADFLHEKPTPTKVR